MKTCLPQALTLLNEGYSVIPVGPNKRPLISWKEYQTRRPTVEEIVSWWTEHPEAQLGIVCGRVSDLTVIDVEAEGDLDLIKDETLTVKTGGGGRHYYFKYNEKFSNLVRVLPNVDVRSEGGYVVAYGSEGQKGTYELLTDTKVRIMSPETESLLLEHSGASRDIFSYTQPTKRSLPEGERDFPEDLASSYPGYGKGQRNDMMTSFIGKVLSRVHPSLWETIAVDVVRQANTKNTPPLSEYELKATFDSIASREYAQNPDGRTYVRQERRDEWGPSEPVAASSATVSESSPLKKEDDGVEHAEVIHVSEAAERQADELSVAYPIDMPPFDDALMGGFSPGEVVIVAGKTGEGKTTILQAWTTTLAMGGLGVEEKLPALWFSYEVLAKPLWEKFLSMGADEETPIYLPSFNESGDFEWVLKMIEEGIDKYGIKVVAIDHIGFLKPPKGNYANYADAITHAVRALKRLAVKRGLIIMLPVHVRKTNRGVPDTDDIRDSGGIANESDTVFFISRNRGAGNTFVEGSKLVLMKNRKTGTAVTEYLRFLNGRFFWNREYSDAFKRQDEGFVESIDEKVETFKEINKEEKKKEREEAKVAKKVSAEAYEKMKREKEELNKKYGLTKIESTGGFTDEEIEAIPF